MGYQVIQLKLPTRYDDVMLRQLIGRTLGIVDFSWQIETKSLDARKKANIHWVLRVCVVSAEIPGPEKAPEQTLVIPYQDRKKKVIVAGSGPAGFFAAFVLQLAGFRTVILERGKEVDRREKGILQFERTAEFDSMASYSFGEGGAGTFSDGKLTSRSKHISLEKDFILRTYIEAGAPEEIRYMTYPHLGSDNLKRIVRNLRKKFLAAGGEIRFETQLTELATEKDRVVAAETKVDSLLADYFIFATGHSSFETYRMLMRHGVLFRTKNFAIGFRAEHHQEEINRAQWGVEHLPGVKAAEYRLSSDAIAGQPVYTFCMCPGGMVVPAGAYPTLNIVNGMSNYKRNGKFANAACVAGIHPDQLAGRTVTPLEALDRLEDLETSFYQFSNGYQAPFCRISDFLKRKDSQGIPETSYPLGLVAAPLWNMLPGDVIHALQQGIADFSGKLKGYEKGILLGLESKTSAPIQVIRENDGRCTGFSNLYLAGEGSGYSGGIISSAADGIRTAMKILAKES